MFLPGPWHHPSGHTLTVRFVGMAPPGVGPLCASCAEYLHSGCCVLGDRWPALLVSAGRSCPRRVSWTFWQGMVRAGPRREGPRLGGMRRAWQARPVSQECWAAGWKVGLKADFRQGTSPSARHALTIAWAAWQTPALPVEPARVLPLREAFPSRELGTPASGFL